MGSSNDVPGAGGQAPRDGRQPSSAEPHPPEPVRRRLRGRVLVGVAGLVAAVLVAGALTAYAEFRGVFGRIHHVAVTGLGKRPPRYDNSMNILLIGSDTRKGKNWRFGAHISGQRSDTIIVLHLSPGLGHAVVMSIPRDSVIPVLNCPPAPGAPGQTAQPGQVEQINETFSRGGAGCLWKTIEHTTGIRIDHFMQLNFTGFEKVINDVGGVNICLPYAINDPHSRLRLTAGRHHVMGAQALAYWRVRYIGLGSDLQRIRRDQYLMASVVQGVRRANLLSSPARVYAIVRDVAGALTTDSGLGQATLISLAGSLRNLPSRHIQFVQVPVVPYQPNPNWVRWAPQATGLFQAIEHDRKLPKRRPGNTAPGISPVRHRHGGGPASPSAPAASPAGTASPAPVHVHVPDHSTISDLSRAYGGLSAAASPCSDRSAFAGPLGG